MKVLVLSPHTDDAEVGCGATIAKHVMNDDKVRWVTFSGCQDALPEDVDSQQLIVEHGNAMAALRVYDWGVLDYPVRLFRKHEDGIRDLIYKYIRKEFRPDIVYTPWLGSLHQDHQIIARSTEQVCRHVDIAVLGYYVCDDGIGFAPRYFEGLEEKHVLKKLEALLCYKTQSELRGWWKEETFRAYLRYWSPSTGHEWTEAFEIIRLVSK